MHCYVYTYMCLHNNMSNRLTMSVINIMRLWLISATNISLWLISATSHPTLKLVCMCAVMGKEGMRDFYTTLCNRKPTTHSKISNTSWHTHPTLPANHLKGFMSFQHILSLWPRVCEGERSIIKDKNTCFMIMRRLSRASTTHIYMTLPLIDWPEIRAHANRCTDTHAHKYARCFVFIPFGCLDCRVLTICWVIFYSLVSKHENVCRTWRVRRQIAENTCSALFYMRLCRRVVMVEEGRIKGVEKMSGHLLYFEKKHNIA